MKVFLIGLPGSGKSTLGKELARALQHSFIDLDEEIEKDCGKPVAAIFKDQGENYFREKESQLLNATISKHQSFVMATGGGAPCFLSGIEVMNAAGITIFLDVPVAEINNRMSNEEKNARPLLASGSGNSLNRLSELRIQRLEFYQKAKITLTGSSNQIEEILKRIEELNS